MSDLKSDEGRKEMATKVCDNKSVGMLVWKGNELLLIERARSPFGFAPPAGHLDEDGDDFEKAAKRELFEEVGLVARSLRLVNEIRQENPCRRGGKWHYWKVYRAEVDENAEIKRSEDETKQVGWYDKGKLLYLFRRTEKYLRGEISEEEWQKSPGLEPVWLNFLKFENMEKFTHEALELLNDQKLVYVAYSKHYAFFRMFISKFVLEQGNVPLNPFLLFDYFLLDTVERDKVREANNNLVKRADEIWVFGPISDGVLAEIKIAQDLKKTIRYFKIKNSQTIIPIISKNEIEIEGEIKEFKNEIKFDGKKIVICGSMRFAKEMLGAKDKLEKMGFSVIVPNGIENFLPGAEFLTKREEQNWEPMEGAKRKIENNLIKGYYDEIEKADAILVANYTKNNIENYIGGNSFLEMGFAHCLGKKIYCLNPLNEEQKVFYQELLAMQPIILNGDLSKICF